jgi:hypothetical protein
MSIDRYDPIRVLGEGSFGKVSPDNESKIAQLCLTIFNFKGLLDEGQSKAKLCLCENN